MSRTLIGAVLVAVGALAAGCGPDCQSTCNRLYQTEQCNIQSPGSTQGELLSTCSEACESALEQPGEVGDYTPNEYTPKSEATVLQNDKQAAIWMDCVATTDCSFLETGYCAPVW